jgi:hypothetical protein
MRVIEYSSQCLILNVENNDYHKKIFLDALDKTQSSYHKEEGRHKVKTDYKQSNANTAYVNYFLQNILSNFKKNILKFWNVSSFGIHDAWFQQYEKGDFHGWHTHPGCNLSGIYYIELPDSNMATQFKTFSTDIKEGEIIIFPSYLKHSSPLFNEGRKTILSFNLSLES